MWTYIKCTLKMNKTEEKDVNYHTGQGHLLVIIGIKKKNYIYIHTL